MKPFIPKGISKHAIVSDLQHSLEDVEELYVVMKYKNGDWGHSMSGDVQGLAFAILILNQYALESL